LKLSFTSTISLLDMLTF